MLEQRTLYLTDDRLGKSKSEESGVPTPRNTRFHHVGRSLAFIVVEEADILHETINNPSQSKHNVSVGPEVRKSLLYSVTNSLQGSRTRVPPHS